MMGKKCIENKSYKEEEKIVFFFSVAGCEERDEGDVGHCSATCIFSL